MRKILVLFLTLFSLNAYSAQIDTGNVALNKTFEILIGRDFTAKETAISSLISGAPAENPILLIEGILNGNLMLHKKTQKVVFVKKESNKYHATDAFTGQELGAFPKRKFKKFSTNNQLRSYIKKILATQNLTHHDKDVRLKAVKSMFETPSQAQKEKLEALIKQEKNAEIKEVITLALAVIDLSANEPLKRLEAIETLSGSLEPGVRAKMEYLSKNDSDQSVKEAAKKTLKGMEHKVSMYGYLETLFFGLSAGTVLVLAAIGLAITFGVMGVINMAHGELIMLGAYTTYIMQVLLPDLPGLALLLSIPVAFMVSGLVGILIERGVIRFLYGRPLETLLATFGVSLILQQLVRTLISPQNVPVANPEFMSGLWQINSVFAVTYNRLYIMLFCLFIFAALFFVLKKTRLGLQVRAVSQNRQMARAMGVRSGRIDALTFGLGSGIAGVAGVALSQITNVGPNLGQAYIVDSFLVVVFGGVGNLWGTLISGLSLGIANKFMEPWAGAVMAKILVLVFVILFIQKRPRGLFPQKGRAAEG